MLRRLEEELLKPEIRHSPDQVRDFLSDDDLREQAAREAYFASQPFCIEVQDEAGNQVLNQPVRYLNGLGTH